MKKSGLIFANCGILTIIVAFVLSCSSKVHYEYLDPESINYTLFQIDSTLATLSGYEPKDSNYVEKRTEYGSPDQETFDESNKTWHKFVSLCRENKFDEAYAFYNEQDKTGDFLVCLKHSTPRYHFCTEVIAPMIFEFEQSDSASVKYHDLLKLEFYLEEFTMQYGSGDSDYIPETFPLIANDLAVCLASRGDVEEALEIVDDYAYAVNGLYGNPAYTNLCVAFFTASVYTNADDNDGAKKTLEGYIEYTSEHKDPDRDPAEYDYYISLVNKALQEQEEVTKAVIPSI